MFKGITKLSGRSFVGAALLSIYWIRDFIFNATSPALDKIPTEADYYPAGLGIEVTNLCNANCVFCAYQYRDRPVTFMPQETFEKIVLQYIETGGGEGGIGLTPVVGDPLIDRDLARKIAYARSFPQIRDIHITTNAILLTRDLFERLVDAGLNTVTVSISGFDENEYKRIYRSPNYKKVIENLRSIAHSDCFKKCRIEIALRSDSLFTWIKKGYWEFLFHGFRISRNLFFDSWSGRIQDRDLPRFMFLRPQPLSKRVPCTMLYAGPQVLADGTVTACGCRDLEGTSELRLGNILETPFKDMVKGKKIEDLRRRFLKGDLPDICRDCTFYSPVTRSRFRRFLKI